MKDKFLSLVVTLLMSGPWFAQGQLRHSSETLYPTYHGLVMAGYQGWFRAEGDGSGAHHFAYGNPQHCGIDVWPDVSEYKKTYETPFLLSDGRHARFFSSVDESTVDVHFHWMQTYGLDGVFMQRFFGNTKPGEGRREATHVLQLALASASKYKRAIAVMYDLSGLRAKDEDCTSIIEDWKYLVDSIRVTRQDGVNTYLHENGKPVVVIWGVGFPDRPYDIRDIGLERLIDFLKNDPVYGHCTVMLGVPTYWRTLDKDCVHDAYLHTLIRQADIIMPWMVGRFSPLLYNDTNRYRDQVQEDEAWCADNHVEYVPCVYPGFSWHNLSQYEFPNDVKPVGSIPREGGQFYWSLLSTAIRAGATMLYVAMFDEVNEGTAIFKVTGQPPLDTARTSFLHLDGEPGDTYLWLTGRAARMLRKEDPLTTTMPQR
ncbi:glycoside hydrolase family 71/99-like protein [Dinghuibacter silviterrae]|uniref:Xylosidase n=1 Tax=Dinghuibacter silviterrae TaxID=1539049 RepID=A0A4R8DIV9_9BACT|nr:glycoside hydrolase family 71/99-like protein [Dinghuibacter silviterrae]TDW96930.1 hypothetical protein EDB95_4766 [Dinghuibacter silviterrae]